MFVQSFSMFSPMETHFECTVRVSDVRNVLFTFDDERSTIRTQISRNCLQQVVELSSYVLCRNRMNNLKSCHVHRLHTLSRPLSSILIAYADTRTHSLNEQMQILRLNSDETTTSISFDRSLPGISSMHCVVCHFWSMVRH